MYWSYLTNINDDSFISNELLTFESNENFDKMLHGYCELIFIDFFSSFSREYNAIFISEYEPNDDPAKKSIKFIIKFNDIDKAKQYCGHKEK